MIVQDVMTRAPRSCRGDDRLVDAARILWDHDCGSVPVVDDAGRPVGIVTDRDCCMAVYTRGRRLDEVLVEQAMARQLFTVRADASIATALQVLRDHRVRRLPVVDAAGKLCGMLSLADVLQAGGRAAGAATVVDTLVAITAPRHAAAAATAPAPAAPAAAAKAEPAVLVPKAPPRAAAAPAAPKKAKARKRK